MMIDATKIVGSVVDGLRSTPVLIALLVLNATGIAAALWYLVSINARNAELFKLVLTACLPGAKP